MTFSGADSSAAPVFHIAGLLMLDGTCAGQAASCGRENWSVKRLFLWADQGSSDLCPTHLLLQKYIPGRSDLLVLQELPCSRQLKHHWSRQPCSNPLLYIMGFALNTTDSSPALSRVWLGRLDEVT